jgi:endonuclease/exonuclease/phosphatase family metal-dependent hydrolase
MGDFNEWNPSGRNLDALRGYFDIHTPGYSFPSSRPFAGLDRIAISKEFSLVDSGVHRCSAAKVASDHLPIWADIVAA